MSDLVERMDDLADRLEQEGHFELYRSDDMVTSAKVWLREDERDLIVEALHKAARNATSLEAKDKELAALREIICKSAAAIGNGSALSPECSVEFMSGLPDEIEAHINKLKRFLKCSRDEGGEALARAETAERRVAELEITLREHHNWHLQAGTIGLQDGDGGWVEIDNAAEYSDSAMYERTESLLAGAPPEEHQPMPRGGINAWWWAQAVLLRRKLRGAERERDQAREALRAETDRADKNARSCRNFVSALRKIQDGGDAAGVASKALQMPWTTE